MPTTIAYDPSLTLGNIVSPKKLEVLKQISDYQDQISSVRNELNNLLLQQTEMTRTQAEIAKLGISTAKIEDGIKAVDQTIKNVADQLGTTIASNAPKIAKAQSSISAINDSIESPIDFSKSQLKTLPLAAPSMKMDSQYFHNESNDQTTNSTVSGIGSYVQQQLDAFQGYSLNENSAAANSAHKQATHQYQNHDVIGTLVITCHCTHSNARLFSPLVIDVDKGIRVWNSAIRDGQLKAAPLDPTNAGSMQGVMLTKDSNFEAELNLLSGVTYGSSFVAMIHVINDTTTQTDEHGSASDKESAGKVSTQGSADSNASASSKRKSILTRILSRIENKMALANAEGKMGLSKTEANEFQDLFSDQQVSVHINIICMGAIPSIASETYTSAVESFKGFDPEQIMGMLNSFQSATNKSQSTISSDADNAKTGANLLAIQSNNTKTVLSAAASYTNEQNSYFDITTLMTAFTNYVSQAQSGNIGVPINYYLAPITGFELARLWIRKYLPDSQFIGISPITNNNNSSKTSTTSNNNTSNTNTSSTNTNTDGGGGGGGGL